MSTLRSILVHADAGPHCAARLLFAHQLAEQHDARLTALFATSPMLVDTSFDFVASGVAVEVLQDLHAARVRRARATFDQCVTEKPGDVVWAELHDALAVQGFSEQAAFADLLVLGQDGDETDGGIGARFAESVVCASGRPALLIPRECHVDATGRVAVVAWQARPESARALTAALPLLAKAEQVHVLSWGRADTARCSGQPLDLQAYLGAHGIEATLHEHADEPRDIGAAILDGARSLDAELLVMGCYGHSRAREFVLGGASRGVLKSMHLPVLTSH